MSRRIDVELTSTQADGAWTWRAAGARLPKGVLDGTLLPAAAKVGDVVKAEADFDVDGVVITAIVPAVTKKRGETTRLEILGSGRQDEQLVTTTLTGRKERGGGRGDRGDRGPRPDRGDRPPRSDRDRDKGGADRPSRPDRDRPDRGPRTGEGAGRGPRGDRPGGDRPGGGERDGRPRRPKVEEPARPKPKRLRPGRAHRVAVLDDLAPEQRPIAEQVLQGGLPAVRAAIEKENEDRAGRNESPVKPDELMALAETLLPRLRTAKWRDEAEAAMVDAQELDLRDLRSVVVSADTAARDDETRELAAQLREALGSRVEAEHTQWLDDLTSALADGRTVRALRLSSRPVKAGSPLAADLAGRLAEAASAALTSDAAPDRWGIVLDAVAYSPVRSRVKPTSIPQAPSEELLATVKKFASRIPDVASAFGIDAASEPARRGPRRPGGPPAAGAKGAPRAGRKALPPPPPPPSSRQAPTPPAGDDAVAPPVAEAPVGEAPVSEAPVSEAPGGEAPVSEAPAVEEPAVEEPAVEASSSEAPGAAERETAAAPPTVTEPDGGGSATEASAQPEGESSEGAGADVSGSTIDDDGAADTKPDDPEPEPAGEQAAAADDEAEAPAESAEQPG